jgi:DNA-binding PadR family transcriptional regulator
MRSFDQRRVYEILNQLEVEGLAWSEMVRDDASPNGKKRVFHATSRGLAVSAELLKATVELESEQEPEQEPVWEDIQVWMLSSRPEEAPDILDYLVELEQDCMEKIEANKEPATHARSWDDRMLSQHRASIREEHRWRLRCLSLARKEIEEYLATQQ